MLGRALLYAAPVSSFVLGLFYYGFGVADRYAVFLYDHLGAGPFHGRTVNRYWMSGLVASGAELVLYAIANWLGGGSPAFAAAVTRRPPGGRYGCHVSPC